MLTAQEAVVMIKNGEVPELWFGETYDFHKLLEGEGLYRFEQVLVKQNRFYGHATERVTTKFMRFPTKVLSGKSYIVNHGHAGKTLNTFYYNSTSVSMEDLH